MTLNVVYTNIEGGGDDDGSVVSENDQSAVVSHVSGSMEAPLSSSSSFSEEDSMPNELNSGEATTDDDFDFNEKQEERFLNMHSYLPGTQHPLCHPELIERKRKQAAIQVIEEDIDGNFSNQPRHQIIELPVLQLAPGIIIYPGSTLPLRLRNPDWVRYLQRQIDRVTLWNDNSVAAASSGNFSRSTKFFDYNRDVVAIGVLPAKFEIRSDDDISTNPASVVGRIGTLALITHLSKEEEDLERRLTDQQRQIVAMALGISRFRILSKIGVEDSNETRRSESNNTREQGDIFRANQRHHFLRRSFYGSWNSTIGGGGDMAEMTTYTVEIIDDAEPVRPPCPSLIPHHTFLHNISTGYRRRIDHQQQKRFSLATEYLGKVSSIPLFAWEKVWPWKLMRLINEQIATISAWEGLRSSRKIMLSSSFTATSNTAHTLLSASPPHSNDPSLFSFWMASNLPFSSEEQMHFLESNCVVSRLLFILNYIEHENGRPLQCGRCLLPVSSFKHLFTVPGTEGTAGAYVNKHGYIHQTITVKEVFEPHVVCLGESEIRDSWFPGYSWTMVFCSYCHNHLGWKFIPADARNTVTPTGNSGSDLNYQLTMRLQEDTTENESSRETAAMEDMNADRERHERSMGAGNTSNKLPYFWGLSGSSVVCSQVSETNQDIAEDFGSVEDGESSGVES